MMRQLAGAAVRPSTPTGSVAGVRRMSRPEPVRKVLTVVVAVQLVVGLVGALGVSPPQAAAIGLGAVELPPLLPDLLTEEPGPLSGDAPGPTAAADATGTEVQLFDAEGAAKPFKSLPNPTWEDVPLVLHVLEDKGDWLRVRVNIRPNGTTAWIRRSEVYVRPIPNRIVIELSERRLTLLRGNEILAQHQVAIGAPGVPTPTGEFYVDATVRIANPNGPYGVGQMSVSGFSNVLKTFGGGIGQIAIHGTNNPRTIGGTVSHGCIRMLNDAWVQVQSMSPNGTPVSIRP
jgi:lipoprotein-anchoring transpeptidase ErfK/SrfK